MTTIRIEVHNENKNGTFVFVTSEANWQDEARQFIKTGLLNSVSSMRI